VRRRRSVLLGVVMMVSFPRDSGLFCSVVSRPGRGDPRVTKTSSGGKKAAPREQKGTGFPDLGRPTTRSARAIVLELFPVSA
jgi:hypothetical protein